MKRRVVIVTGGGRGIGQATCLRFAADGDQIVSASRSVAQLDETKRRVEDAGGSCLTVATDVGCRDDVQALIQTTAERFGRIDVLVNNAGMAVKEPVEEIDDAAFTSMVGVNISGVFYACKYAWPILRDQGGGVIINVSSIAAVDPFPGFSAYGATKAWVNTFTRAIAAEGRPHDIRVFGVAPGGVATNMLRGLLPDYPLEQALTPADVAEMIHVLTQPGCAPATGEIIAVRK
jgi:3-oxoacyl-[acyl-carrier protein] reductase